MKSARETNLMKTWDDVLVTNPVLFLGELIINNYSPPLAVWGGDIFMAGIAVIVFSPTEVVNVLRVIVRFQRSCQVIYSQFDLAIHQNDHQARRRFVEWAQNEIAVVPDFHKRILFSDEAHFWLNGYVNQQNCRIWSEGNPQVYVETPLHPEKLTVWCALWAGGILLQKR
ncbi:hypothetical protein TNCV_3973401 [Trichonephila clavipes]|nr:hypothetical protein TNCV_3973401 [Trichonephila clavipes]